MKSKILRVETEKETWTNNFVYALPRYWGKPLLSSTSKSPRLVT